MSETMNGVSTPKVIIANPLTELLEKLLQEARTGALTSLAVAVSTPQRQIGTFCCGAQFADLYVGVGILDTLLMTQITQPQQQQNRIIRAGMAG